MLKYTSLIQQIECLMDDPTAAPMEKIAELATSYAEAVEWVNEKVLFCVSTLRQGNASEALRLCHELDLLENYKTLVFDDYDAWLSAALTFGDVAIPAFNRRLIDELDAALVCMRPIEEILKSHRILALSHSPLSARIPVLRKLVELDPRNAGWKRELREYESARLEMIFDELSKNLSFDDCLGLLKEIEGSKWSVEIPLKIKKKIAVIKQEYQKKNRQKKIDQYNARLNEIAENLLQSYNIYDFEGAKRWRSSWFKTLNEFQDNQIIPPYELIHSVDEVLNWIESEQKGRDLLQEYNSKVAAVDREMKRSISIDKCQRLILDLTRAAETIGQEVPERFQNHLDKLIANEERKETRRGRFATGIFTIILLVVIGGVSFGCYEFIQWYQFNSLKDNLANYALAVGKDNKILAEAYEFVLKLESSGYKLALYPDIQKNIAYIKMLHEKDMERHEDWKLLFDKIERSVKKGDFISQDEIDELEELTVSQEEKDAVAGLILVIRGMQSEQNEKFVKEHKDQLQGFQETFDDMLNSGQIGDAVKLLDLESQVKDLKQEFSDYAFNKPALQTQAKEFEEQSSKLIESIENAIEQLNTDKGLQEALDKLASQMNSKSEYLQALQSIIDKHAKSSYMPDFKAVIEEQDEWGAAFVWNELINQNMAIFKGGKSRATSLFKSFVADWNATPFKPQELSTVKNIDGRIPYFQSIVDSDRKAILEPINDLCDIYGEYPFTYHEAKDKDDEDKMRRFFFKGPIVANKYYDSMKSVSEVSDKRIKIEASNPIVPLNNVSFSKRIYDLCGMINDNTKISECGIQILSFIYQDSSLKDPIIKYQFMITALTSFTQSDKIIQENFGTYVEQIDSSELKQCNPFDLRKSETNRREAERMLGRLKDFEQSVEKAQKRIDQLAHSFDVQKLDPVGWIEKDNSQWTVRGIPEYVTGNLYVVKKSGLILVGTVQNKEIEMQTVSDLKRGIPVFIIKTVKP